MVLQEGAFPSSPRLAPRAPREPGAAMRALARVRSFSLDARLAAGEDPAGSRLLAAQAARLTDPRRRELLAAALGGLLLAAREGPRISRVTPNRSAVLTNEESMRELARRVDSPETVYARGLARLERLLSDASGPAFDGSAAALAAELGRVERELRGVSAGPIDGDGVPVAARRRSVGRLARLRGGPGMAPGTPGFTGSSFALPDGSWFHGRRDGG